MAATVIEIRPTQDDARARLDAHAPPRWVQVARTQHMLMLHSGRVWWLLAMVAMALLVPSLVQVAFGRAPTVSAVPAAQRFFGWSVWISAIWALMVWRHETRGRRAYQTSQPVPRPMHELWRVTAGASWLVVALVSVIPLALLLSLVDDTTQLFGYGFAFWINFITLPLFVYLAYSVLPMLTRNPFRAVMRVIGAAFLFMYLAVPVWPALAENAIRFAGWWICAPYGLRAAFLGGLNIARVQGLGLDALGTGGVIAPTTTEFLVATALWLTLAAVGVVLAARRAPA